MSDRRATSLYKIGSAYDDFIQYFRSAGEDADSIVKYPDRPWHSCFTQSEVGTSATFKGCLYLKKWPCRQIGGKRLDIVIKALETFVKPEKEWFLVKSTVHLNYFVVSSSTVDWAQSLHYDFVDGGQGNHPFFHVQLTDELIHADDIRSTGCDLELPQDTQSNQCWVTTRIPTPDMTLPSMLYCLVAGHLGESIFAQFAEKVHPILQDRLPHPNFNLLKRSLQGPLVHFKSSHWFTHMRKSDDQHG